MKATDLMIGDWVQSFPNQCRVDGIICLREEHTAEEKWMAIVHLGGNKYERVNVNILEPIPLTPEILEKNGWKIEGTSKAKYYWHEEVPFCLPMCGFEYSNGRNVSSDKLFADDFFETVNMRLSFVHKLQHALKSCEIEKEIIL